jgi:hypothetical protein
MIYDQASDLLSAIALAVFIATLLFIAGMLT